MYGPLFSQLFLSKNADIFLLVAALGLRFFSALTVNYLLYSDPEFSPSSYSLNIPEFPVLPGVSFPVFLCLKCHNIFGHT
jgi:hypothetical protein